MESRTRELLAAGRREGAFGSTFDSDWIDFSRFMRSVKPPPLILYCASYMPSSLLYVFLPSLKITLDRLELGRHGDLEAEC